MGTAPRLFTTRSLPCEQRGVPLRPIPRQKQKWISRVQNRGDKKGPAARGLATNRRPSGAAAASLLVPSREIISKRSRNPYGGSPSEKHGASHLTQPTCGRWTHPLWQR